MYVILVYDIKSDEGGQKVLSKTFKTCKKYLSHIQNSVFEGELTTRELKQLETEIYKIIKNTASSVVLYELPSIKPLNKRILGCATRNNDIII